MKISIKFFIIKTIVFKDFIEEIKSKEIFISILSYSTLVLVVVATTQVSINQQNFSQLYFGYLSVFQLY